MSPILIWFFIGTAFILLELFLPGFVVLFFGIGAWAASLTAAIQHSLEVEIAVFIAASLISLLVLRKKLMQVFQGRSSGATGEGFVSSLTGKTGLVTKPIAPGARGEIELSGSYWRAVADVAVAEGESVVVLGNVEGDELTLRVRPEKTA